MRTIFLGAALAAAVFNASAPTVSAQSGPELRLPEQLDEMFRDMMEQMKPAIDGALDAMREFEHLDDPRNYHMPERLPNGDIIIRRRDDAPPLAPEDAPQTGPQPDGSIKT